MKRDKQQALFLPLAELKLGEQPGISPAWGAAIAEAAAVCLDNQQHPNPANMELTGTPISDIASVQREEVTDQMLRSWADMEVTAELGAYGIASLLVPRVTDYCIIERSRKGTGFDYWLGKPDGAPLFQEKARMEVSGILKGDKSTVASRVKTKLKQTAPTDGTMQALIVVAEFGTPQAVLQWK